MVVIHTIRTVNKTLKRGNQAHLIRGALAGNGVEGQGFEPGLVYNKGIVGSCIKLIGTVVRNGVRYFDMHALLCLAGKFGYFAYSKL